MTAEIGVLNKTAIVLAADSAVTIDTKKVYNTANKIFQLSYVHPVAIMIYNNAQWMGIPWEIIIKQYSEQLKAKSFPTIQNYVTDFIKYLKIKFCPRVSYEAQVDFLVEKLTDVLHGFFILTGNYLETAITEGKIKRPKTEKEENRVFSELLQKVVATLLAGRAKEKRRLTEFKRYEQALFTKFTKTSLKKRITEMVTVHNLDVKPAFSTQVIKHLYYDLVVEISGQDNYSGVVIAGYGNDEIYPVIYELRVAEYFDKRLRHAIKHSEYINDDVTAIVAPIAQRDMVDTFVDGIASNVLGNISDCIYDELSKTLKDIEPHITKKSMKKVVDKVMSIHQSVGKSTKEYRTEKHQAPMLKTVSFLSKEGMIELAESLVNITSLKRKTSSDIESVGGPIDIVIITKADGFIWVKNKSVIDQKLNQHFYSKLEKAIWDH